MVYKTRIVIRCREETKNRFKSYCKQYRMDYEEALNRLLDQAGWQRIPELKRY